MKSISARSRWYADPAMVFDDFYFKVTQGCARAAQIALEKQAATASR